MDPVELGLGVMFTGIGVAVLILAVTLRQSIGRYIASRADAQSGGEEIGRLQARVDELEDRLDFAERVVGQLDAQRAIERGTG